MTKEEIVVLQSVYATGIYDAGYDVQKESQRALDALEAANREIERLKATIAEVKDRVENTKSYCDAFDYGETLEGELRATLGLGESTT